MLGLFYFLSSQIKDNVDFIFIHEIHMPAVSGILQLKRWSTCMHANGQCPILLHPQKPSTKVQKRSYSEASYIIAL